MPRPRDLLSGRLLSARRRAGFIESVGPWGELVTGDVLRCCHCSAYWVHKTGSGRRRGYCTLCDAVTCGKVGCLACVPCERRLENVEAGRDALTPAAPLVAVPAGYWTTDDG